MLNFAQDLLNRNTLPVSGVDHLEYVDYFEHLEYVERLEVLPKIEGTQASQGVHCIRTDPRGAWLPRLNQTIDLQAMSGQ